MPVASRLLGVDFTCAPTPRKPIVVAHGRADGDTLVVERLEHLTALAAFEALLAEPGPWLGGFDMPFGLPRAFVEAHALGDTAAAIVDELHRRCDGRRMAFRGLVDAWGNGRPAGQRLVHRATDRACRPMSSSPLQTRYVPVGFMYFEGFARLVRAGVHVPGLHAGDAARVAVEAYPARAAHAIVGARSYKNSAAPDRVEARAAIVQALMRGEGGFGFRLSLPRTLRATLIDDTSGDALDATLCLVQAAWAARQPGHGVPVDVDVIEGWIVTAPA
ncbi:MAG: DUF429 domain-containing protein [Betaproteobacteria bacterium]|nr:DUF429 domain-containing protein [Betaproteobacteria bacterium]